MNTSTLKTFAQAARRKLLQLIGARLDYVLTADTAELRQQATQVKELRAALRKEGRDLLIERVAYTWFNRLAALRFMDANGFHSFGARVISPATANETLPELLQQARAGVLDADLRESLAHPRTFEDLLSGRIPVSHPEAQVYRLLLLAVCNHYHRLMPFLFEKMGAATELLLPEDLLTEHSIVVDFREYLADEDCHEVEVIGWLYQFYISEKKDAVMGLKKAVQTEDIPAVTQLFTPHWIVRYLVENSLGRLWLLNRPLSRLRERMPYYIEGEAEKDFLKLTRPEDIRLLDPAVGSGHMLTYAFDLLYAIYEEEGYDAPEIPSLILRHNLYGVEICERASALAAFALCMKARSRDNRYFRRVAKGGADAPQPQILELRDVRFAENEVRDYIHALGLGDLFHQPMLRLLYQFEEAKNFGSLIQPCLDERAIGDVRRAIEAKDLGGQLFLRETHLKVLRVLEQAEVLTQRYHVVVANPPYMGSNGMNNSLAAFTKKYYAECKADLMTCFMDRARSLCVTDGLWGMVNIPTWMFLSSFEDLRKTLLSSQIILSLVHLGRGLFGADFGAVAFSIQNTIPNGHCVGTYRRLFEKQVDVRTPERIRELFLDRAYGHHTASQITFLKIPGTPIAYWISPKLQEIFINAPKMSSIVDAKQGLSTSDNPRFVRQWWEVSNSLLGRSGNDRSDFSNGRLRWAMYNKGGSFRRWYGNQEHVIWWRDDGRDIESLKPRSVLRGSTYYFQKSVSWLDYTVSRNSFRVYPEGFIFDTGAHSAFSKSEHVLDQVICFGNSKAFEVIATVINPTVHFHSGNFLDCPRVDVDEAQTKQLTRMLVEISKRDWDNFETSWDFRDQPLPRSGLKGATLEASWRNWEAHSTAAIRRMQELETENNRLFIAAYGLNGELQPEVPEEQITLAHADARRDMAAFLSYAVGCMMGRYSLDQPGLLLADAGATVQDYLAKVPNPTFAPDPDGILPVLDGEWFADDIVGRFREFLRVTFGEERLAENLAFIEHSLGKPDKSGKIKPLDLRTYFARDFYKNHISNERAYGYKKRPIYWLFSSPEGSFQALIYLHRYTRDTVNLLLNDYVREFLGKLEERHRQLTAITLNESARPSDRTRATNELGKIDRMLKEVRTWERDVLLPLAQQRIELDLDDGVKMNYLKFKGAVAVIPGLEKKDEDES
jgi:hypothetical protein